MVLQYKSKKETRWHKYLGKERLKKGVSAYDFRLLDSKGKKILVAKGSYASVMKRFRQIEFFKHR